MTLREEIEDIFNNHNMPEKVAAVLDYIHQEEDRLESAEERFEKTGNRLIIQGIKEKLAFIYMIEMVLTRFKQELNIQNNEVLEHLEIKSAKKPTSQSLATEEVGNHSESYLRNNSLKS